MMHSLRVAALSLALVGVDASDARAQFGVHVVGANINHELTGPTFGGYAHFPIEKTRLRVGFEYLRGSSNDLRSECAGLVPIDEDCAPRPGVNDYSLATIPAEFLLGNWRRGNFAADIILSGRVGSIASSFRANGSDRKLSASKAVFGGHAGIATSWLPWANGRAGLELSAAVGGLKSFRSENCCDGYWPFNDGISFTRATIGTTYRF